VWSKGWLWVNSDWWNTLPSDLQQIVEDSRWDASYWAGGYALQNTNYVLRKCEEAGVKINKMSEEERMRMKERLRPIYEDLAKEHGEEYMERLTGMDLL
jgi:TRAP-type C4-dicarboxylate transport system substrate-binding protein